MKRALVALMLVAVGAASPAAYADDCSPVGQPVLWVDFAGHNAPIQAKPGLVLAVASGTDIPAQMRAAGANTVFFDLNFNKRVGTPASPADPALIPTRAKALFDHVLPIVGCTTPYIALNELFGAQTPTPWTPTNAQYRENVLVFVEELAKLGAKPLISIANPPYTGSTEAVEWWRRASRSAILLRQVYFTSPNAKGLAKLGPVGASRLMRQSMRGLMNKFTQIGIPSNRLSLQLQFHSGPGLGARAGLQPTSAWLRLVKLEALAANHVAREYKLHSVWSWGWAIYNPNVKDPDKAATACVWLWARDQSLCDGPGMAGAGFNASLTEGQLILPRGALCTFPGGQITRNAVNRFRRLTGDVDYATSILFEQEVLKAVQRVRPQDFRSAERAVLRASFGGNRKRFRSALTRAQLTPGDARSIIASRLRRDLVQARFRLRPVTRAQLTDFLSTYAGQRVRLVSTTKKAPWLGGKTRGWVVETLGPPDVFRIKGEREIDTVDGSYVVTPLGPAMPLSLLPRSQAKAAAQSALMQLARAQVYRGWLRSQQLKRLTTAVCFKDRLPTPGATDPSPFVPFLVPG